MPGLSALDGGANDFHRAAPLQERAVRAPGPDDQQRAANHSAEAGNHPTGWTPETASRARVLSWPPGPSLFRKPRQPLFARNPVTNPVAPAASLEPIVWSGKRGAQTAMAQTAMAGAPEFNI